MAKECLVIPTEVLIQEQILPPKREQKALYIPIANVGGVDNIYRLAATYGKYRERFGLEGIEYNPAFQQLIMYAFVLKGETFLAYQRGDTEEGKYDESRLAGKISLGLGGHMERTDLALRDSLFREIDEEAQVLDGNQFINFREGSDVLDIESMKRLLDFTPVGLIKDERDDVGQVHLGIACQLKPKSPNKDIDIMVRTTRENINYKYLTVEEYLGLIQSEKIMPEGWSDIVFRNEISPRLRLLTPPSYNPRSI